MVDPELERNRQLWNEKKIADYDFVASIREGGMSNIAEPVLIKVRGGKYISIDPISKSEKRPFEAYNRYETVDKMFDTVQEELDKGLSYVKVKYDKELGYPQDIGIVSKTATADGSTGCEIKKFEAVK